MSTGELGAPSPQEQANLLYGSCLLDVTKLLDIAALYAPENLAPTRQLLTKVRQQCMSKVITVERKINSDKCSQLNVTSECFMQAFTLEPRYGGDLAELVPTMVTNFSDVRMALVDATERLQTDRNSSVLPSLLGKQPKRLGFSIVKS